MHHTRNLGDRHPIGRSLVPSLIGGQQGALRQVSIDILNGVGAKLLAISHYMDHDNAMRKHQPVRLRKPDWLTMRV